jgi:hypothetical protein
MYIYIIIYLLGGLNRVVSTAPRYGLDGQGIESRWGRQPTTSNFAQVKERVELHHLWDFMGCYRAKFTLFTLFIYLLYYIMAQTFISHNEKNFSIVSSDKV